MYKKTRDIEGNETDEVVFKIDEGIHIPANIKNGDYQRYLRWVNEGGVIDPSDEETIEQYRANKKAGLIALIKDSLFETTKTLDEIRTKWGAFKNNLSSLGTKEEVDASVSNAISWLGL